MHIHRTKPPSTSTIAALEAGSLDDATIHQLRDGCRAVIQEQYLTTIHHPITGLLTPALIPAFELLADEVWKFWAQAVNVSDPAALDLSTRLLRSATAVWAEGVYALPLTDNRDPIVQAVQLASMAGARAVRALARLCHPAMTEPLAESYRSHVRFLATVAVNGDEYYRAAEAMLRSVSTMASLATDELEGRVGRRQLAIGAQLHVAHEVFDKKFLLPFHWN